MPLLLGDEAQPPSFLGSTAQHRGQGGLLWPVGVPGAQGLQHVAGGHSVLVPPEVVSHQLQVAWPGGQLGLQGLPLLLLDQRGDGTGAVLVA